MPFRASLGDYQRQADDLLNAWNAGDRDAVQIIRRTHPRFLGPDITWLPRKMSESDVRSVALEQADARLALARWYDFASWPRLAGHVEAASRVTHFDPPVHRATLLHYLAANGVEGYRQRTPKSAVDIAKLLLRTGAEVDALADMYGGQHTTMSMLVSSTPPAQAGLQVPLVNSLLDFGAAVEPTGSGGWTSPLMTRSAGRSTAGGRPSRNIFVNGIVVRLESSVGSRLLVESASQEC